MKWQDALKNSAHIKRQVTKRQTQQIFNLCALFNQDGALMLDIGTFHGFSASIMAQAAPRAGILSINPNDNECKIARMHLRPYRNVVVHQCKSGELLKAWNGSLIDFIFVDGDHNRVNIDIGWYKYVKAGGLMLFHDYNPDGCGAESPILKKTLDAFMKKLGRPFDYLLIDEERKRGMVGINRWEEHK